MLFSYLRGMKLSAKGKEFLIKEEGLILKPYKDQVGIPTIGVGNTFYEDGRKVKMTDPPITRDRALDLMNLILKQFEDAVNGALGSTKVNQNQFDALVSLAWNIGTHGFKMSTLAKTVKANPNDPKITELFKQWKNAGGKPILLNRRTREALLYFTPMAGAVETKITTSDLNLRLGAGSNHKVLSVLPKGTEVNVLETEGSWSHVFVCGSKLTGFVSSSYLK